MSWNQPQPEAVPSFKKSVTAWMTRVCAEDGVIATKLTPTSLGGGFGSNWYANTPEGVWCQSATGAGIDRMAKRLMEDEPDAIAVNAILTPVIPRVFESISARQTQKIEMNNNFGGNDGRPVGLFGRDIQAPNEKKPVVEGECELCGSKKHILADCIERGHNGHVSGCTICNSRKHYVDSCEQFKSMSLTEQVKILVSQRAKRPPLKTSKPWHTYLHEFCTSDEFVPGVVVGFPWSKSFIEGQGRIGLRKIQSAYDADPDNYVFEVDPATSSWEMVHETHWKPMRKRWPTILNQFADVGLAAAARANDQGEESGSDMEMDAAIGERVGEDAPNPEGNTVEAPKSDGAPAQGGLPGGFDPEMDVGELEY